MRYTPISKWKDESRLRGLQELRGREVVGGDGERIGHVDDLLVDEGGTARYLDVHAAAADEHVLVPLDSARVDEADGAVRVECLHRDDLAELPVYTPDRDVLDERFEASVNDAFAEREGRRREEESPADAVAAMEAEDESLLGRSNIVNMPTAEEGISRRDAPMT